MMRLRQFIKAIEPYPREHFKDKAIAVGLAMLLWMGVNSVETVREPFQNVPVAIVNLPPNLAVSQAYTDTITIWARGSEANLRNLSAGRLSPALDLSDAVAGDNIFVLDSNVIAAPRGVELERVDPQEINIVLENRTEKYVEISPVVAGEPAAGYEVRGKITDPAMAWINGPRSLIDQIDHIPTATVGVAGLRESFTQTVRLVPDSTFVEVSGDPRVQLSIEIVEKAMTLQFDGVPVLVTNTEYRTDVNPSELSVLLSGPQSILEQIAADAMTMIIDARDLTPQADDYLLEPTVRFEPSEIGDQLEVLAILPQRRINVHVYDTRVGMRPFGVLGFGMHEVGMHEVGMRE